MGFSYSNNTNATNGLSLVKLGLHTNYAEKNASATGTLKKFHNLTSALDQPEIISISVEEGKIDTGTSVKGKKFTSDVNPIYPPQSTKAIKYTAQLSELHRSTDASGITVDQPIVCKIMIAHGVQGQLSTDDVKEIISRAASVFFTDEGTSRIPVFQRGCIEIDAD